MDHLTAAFDAVRARARAADADRATIDDLVAKTADLRRALEISIELGGGVDDATAEVVRAMRLAADAIQTRRVAELHRRCDLIAAVPASFAVRTSLVPIGTVAQMQHLVEEGRRALARMRDDGRTVGLRLDGTWLAPVGADDLSIDPGQERGDEAISLRKTGRWKLSTIEAMSAENGLAFLDDRGRMVEIEASA